MPPRLVASYVETTPPTVIVAVRMKGDEWLVHARYLEAADGLRLAEVHVMPYEPPIYLEGPPPHNPLLGTLAGRPWSGDPGVLERMRPPHAIRQAILRTLPLREMQRCAEKQLDRARKDAVPVEDPPPEASWEEKEAGVGRRLARRALLSGISAEDRLTSAQIGYLEAAATYVRLPMPNWHDVVAALGLEGDDATLVVRDRLKAARNKRYGFLQSPGHGSKGGALTPRGEHLAAIYLNKNGHRRRLTGQP